MIDVLSLVIGFVFGVIVVGLAIELGMKKTSPSEPASRYTNNWNISEISNPRVTAEYLVDVELPENSRIIVNQYKNAELLDGLNVKKHVGVKGNFIVGDDRALILSGPLKKGELGFWTIEKDIMDTLIDNFEKLWSEGKPVQEKK